MFHFITILKVFKKNIDDTIDYGTTVFVSIETLMILSPLINLSKAVRQSDYHVPNADVCHLKCQCPTSRRLLISQFFLLLSNKQKRN